MEKFGLVAVNRDKHAARGGLEREPLEALVAAGKSIAEIAAEVGRSKTTVRYWLRRHQLRTKRSAPHRDGMTAGLEAGLHTIRSTCSRHGESELVLRGDGYYRCKRCRVDAVVRRRRKVKAILISEAGGRCVICAMTGIPVRLGFTT